ncbi:MAG: hypothetical protein ACOCXH_13890 [Cyclobacteriaceae bacterium]
MKKSFMLNMVSFISLFLMMGVFIMIEISASSVITQLPVQENIEAIIISKENVSESKKLNSQGFDSKPIKNFKETDEIKVYLYPEVIFIKPILIFYCIWLI